MTVEYRNLSVHTEALVGSASIPTVASVPTTFVKVCKGIEVMTTSTPRHACCTAPPCYVDGRV